MTRERKLKPCPWCGGEARAIFDNTSDYSQHDHWRVDCVSLKCGITTDNDRDKTQEQAEKRWNTREPKPTDAEMVEVIKLAFCQTEVPHLKGYSMADYYRTYPELASRSDEHAKAALQKLREEGMI